MDDETASAFGFIANPSEGDCNPLFSAFPYTLTFNNFLFYITLTLHGDTTCLKHHIHIHHWTKYSCATRYLIRSPSECKYVNTATPSRTRSLCSQLYFRVALERPSSGCFPSTRSLTLQVGIFFSSFVCIRRRPRCNE